MAKKIYKVISWVVLILTVISLWLVVRKPSLPTVEDSPEAAQSFDEKLNHLAEAHQQGTPAEVHITETELNSKLREAFQSASSSDGPSTLRAVTARLVGEKLFATLTIQVLAVNVYVTLGGHPGVRNHQLQLDLTEVKMGSLPLPASMVAEVLREKLDSPELGEVMRLPDSIKDVPVENGELVLDAR